MKHFIFLASFLLLSFLTFSQKPVPKSSVSEEVKIKNFLHSTPGTYGWKRTTGTYFSYDFIKGGRLHIQGDDGEGTMWEGKWKLTGDKLTITNTDTNETKNVTVKIGGEKLILGDEVFIRSK